MLRTRNDKRVAGRDASANWQTVGILAVVTAAAALLRLWGIGDRSLWLDEATSDAIARLDWISMFRVVWSSEPFMALYYAVLHLWVKLGDSEAWLRWPSAFFGTVSVPAIYVLASLLFGRRTGLIAAVLLAFNPVQVHYSREARSYALVVLLSTLSSILFFAAVTGKRAIQWAGYIGATVAAGYAHFFSVLLVPANWTEIAFLPRDRRTVRNFALATIAIGLMLAPLALAVSQASPQSRFDWISTPDASRLIVMFLLFAGGSGGRSGLLIAMLDLVAVLGFAFAWRQARQRHEPNLGSYGFSFAGLAAPIAIVIVVSFFRPILTERYLLPFLPAFVVIVAAGYERILESWIGYPLALVLIAASLVQAIAYHGRIPTESPQEDWRQAVKYVIDNAEPGDAVIIYPGEARFGYDYYARAPESTKRFPDILFPQWDQYFRLDGDYVYNRPAQASEADAILARAKAHARIWLIVRTDDRRAQVGDGVSAIVASLRHSFPAGRVRQYSDIEVFLFTAGGAGSKPVAALPGGQG